MTMGKQTIDNRNAASDSFGMQEASLRFEAAGHLKRPRTFFAEWPLLWQLSLSFICIFCILTFGHFRTILLYFSSKIGALTAASNECLARYFGL